jgi:hypothetical protein
LAAWKLRVGLDQKEPPDLEYLMSMGVLKTASANVRSPSLVCVRKLRVEFGGCAGCSEGRVGRLRVMVGGRARVCDVRRLRVMVGGRARVCDVRRLRVEGARRAPLNLYRKPRVLQSVCRSVSYRVVVRPSASVSCTTR